MVQKTVRFYEESSKDVKALSLLDEYRRYGFNSCREMIIAAVNSFSQGKETSSGVSSIDIEELADAIAKRLNVNVTTRATGNVGEIKEENNYDNNESEDNFAKAMDFINSL